MCLLWIICCFFFHRSIIDNLVNPVQEHSEEWKKSVAQLDKEHAKGGELHRKWIVTKIKFYITPLKNMLQEYLNTMFNLSYV